MHTPQPFGDAQIYWQLGTPSCLTIQEPGKSFSLFIHLLSGAEGTIVSRNGEAGDWVYRLLIDAGNLVFEFKTDWCDEPLRLQIPVMRIGTDQPHGVLLRYSGPNLEMFVDGVLVDEEWPIGTPKADGPQTLVIDGVADQAALWPYALCNEQIETLSGGGDMVAQRELQIMGDELGTLQYWEPRDPNAFVGDCMPFYHDGIFHLFYLLDRRHHQSKWRYGAHQWAHASSTDLVNWEHHPLAIPITEEWEGSICTGSMFFWDGITYGFYATRTCDVSPAPLQCSVSTDGVHFEKSATLARLEPPYYPVSTRDPVVFYNEQDGLFHMLATTHLENLPVGARGGCLAHLVSSDLSNWKQTDPFIVPGYTDEPECADYFHWGDWYYLLFSNDGNARYRMSRYPMGPWHRREVDMFDGPQAIVMKTAEFTGNRRIGAAFVRRSDSVYAGKAIFREIIQHEDGTLGTAFVTEMIPEAGEPLKPLFVPLTSSASGHNRQIRICDEEGYGAAALHGLPKNIMIEMDICPAPGSSNYGVCVCSAYDGRQGHELRFDTNRRTVEWVTHGGAVPGAASRPAILHSVRQLDRPFHLTVIVKDDIVDMCIDGCRTLIARVQEFDGRSLLFNVQNADVTFDAVVVREILPI